MSAATANDSHSLQKSKSNQNQLGQCVRAFFNAIDHEELFISCFEANLALTERAHRDVIEVRLEGQLERLR